MFQSFTYLHWDKIMKRKIGIKDSERLELTWHGRIQELKIIKTMLSESMKI